MSDTHKRKASQHDLIPYRPRPPGPSIVTSGSSRTPSTTLNALKAIDAPFWSPSISSSENQSDRLPTGGGPTDDQSPWFGGSLLSG